MPRRPLRGQQSESTLTQRRSQPSQCRIPLRRINKHNKNTSTHERLPKTDALEATNESFQEDENLRKDGESSENENQSDDDALHAAAEVNPREDDAQLGSSENAASETFKDNLSRLRDALLTHLVKTTIGGEKQLTDAKPFTRTLMSFLEFANDQNEEFKEKAFDYAIRQILFKAYPLIGKYLEKYKKYKKCGTILNYWNHILTSLRFFHYDCEMNRKKCRGSLRGFEHYMKRLRKAYSRAMRREKLAKNATYENLVKQGRLPSGGLKELFGYTNEKLPWVLSLESKDFENRQIYNSFTDWLYSVFWVSMIQGRKSGLEDLKYSQRFGLLDPNGHETTTNFKTSKIYELQALSSSEIFAIGLEVYLDKARKHVAKDENLYADDAPLFLTFQGKRETRAGAKVISKSNNINNNNNSNNYYNY